jgi:hypothetical protein
MSDPQALTVIKGGISRLRTKGAALKDSLYDLLNAYVTMQGTLQPRGGTIRKASLSQVTKGLMFFDGGFHVFANTPTSVPTGYICHVLQNPSNPAIAISKIHFAAPFMGFPYVAAEFTDGQVFHYWLQSDGTWTANTVYFNGDYVLASPDNGFAYAATRLEPPHPVWQPNIGVALNDIFEPTIYNGYMFKAIAVLGDSPHTGSVEPAWPTTENATIQEFGDFSSSSSASTGSDSSTQQPGTSITDRYGNPSVFDSQLGTQAATAPTVTADSTISVWNPGTLYQPGAVVRPSTGQGAFINAIPNGDLEGGETGWDYSSNPAGPANVSIITDPTHAYQGTHVMQATLNHQTSRASMQTFGTVTAGQSVTATAYVNPNNSGANLGIRLNLAWYDSGSTLITRTQGTQQQGSGYRQATVTGNAPANAVKVKAEVEFATGTNPPGFGYADIISWDLETPAAVSNFLFEAVQAAAGTSGSTEPAWPTIEGGTVVDGGVTWEAIGTSIITWEALPIMKSGSSQPTFPTVVGNTVADGNMTWTCADRRVTDSKCPNTKYVCILSSKIFCGDDDIVAFSATTNPLDWSSANDAGFIPFGLNKYGSSPVRGLEIYRSNLMIFNALGYQMWQTDEDPANMAILDAEPVGCTFYRSLQPVNNDLALLALPGIRSVGIAGASTNLQAGQFGKAVDPLVKKFLAALTGTQEPRGLFYPGSGQYWLFFGLDAMVLTSNGGAAAQSWSRFHFPYEMTDWAIDDGTLYLRVTASGTDYVWQYDPGNTETPGTLVDDSGGGNIAISNLIWWPYLDFGPIGLDKFLEGFDMACNGAVSISFGYNQKDFSQVTSSYTIDGDTLDQAGMVPFPVTSVSIQPRLSFTAGQQWEWQAMNLYIDGTTHP